MKKKIRHQEDLMTTEYMKWVTCIECGHLYFIEEDVPLENVCTICGSHEYDEQEDFHL